MTLVEVVLAMAILGVIVVVVAAGLRVGLRAWAAGEAHAAAQQEVRAVVELVTGALSAAYPYRGRLGGGLDRVVLFQGEAAEVRFVTTAAPLGLDAAAAPFHAVALGDAEADHFALRERVVPAEAPFEGGAQVVLSRAVTGARFEYLDDTGVWRPEWDGQAAGGLPVAVRVELSLRPGSRVAAVPAFVVPIPLGKRPG